MAYQTSTVTTQQPTKFSRYRSVRNAAATDRVEVAPPASIDSSTGVSRTPSRYRRPTRPRTEDAPALPKPHTIEKNSNSLQNSLYPTTLKGHTPPRQATRQAVGDPDINTHQAQQNLHDDPHQFAGSPVQPQHVHRSPTLRHEASFGRTTSNTTHTTSGSSPRSYEAAREEARMILEGEFDRLQRIKEIQKKAEHKLRAAAQSSGMPARTRTLKDNKATRSDNPTSRHDLGTFKDAPKVAASEETTQVQKQIARVLLPGDQAPKLRIQETIPSPPVLEANFDAPVSAVNAGERRVEIRFDNASSGITLPVTPSTTVRELLNSASICLSTSFNPQTAVLVESFSHLGLERSLRRYERIRDVMNSWDSDTQNYLVIMPDNNHAASGLETKDVPVSQPRDITFHMYHSLKPGKWDKQYVTLKADGQVTISKRENSGDTTNICHLSDFDIYTPTKKQFKKLKSPKKICLAVKSQQKSAMFLEGINFVHFFVTNEKQIADQWYKAVQTWRSWYLANVLGECLQKIEIDKRNAIPNVVVRQSQEIPYQLGSFKPLLDLSKLKFRHSTDSTAPGITNNNPRVKSKPSIDLGNNRMSIDRQRHLNPSHTDIQRRPSRHNPSNSTTIPQGPLLHEARNRTDLGLIDDDQAFTGSGLLARSASRRSQGGRASGHGVVGSKGKPLVDLAAESEFLDGSLLRKLEAWSATQGNGVDEMKIDRVKRVEGVIKVGEAL